jgi:probable F420-dependent oxidoreductase
MKFWVNLVNTEEVDQFVEIAKAAEALGFHGISVPDHLAYPAKIDTPYPYTEDGKVWWPNTVPWPDPWITLTAMGMATSELQLATNIYLAAMRDPFTVSRATSAAAIFTGNRVALGVAAGWIAEEYALADIALKDRGRVLDEVIACVRGLNTGEAFAYSGEFFNFDAVIMQPAADKPVPVWVGGASKPALARAARNDGWLGVPLTKEQNAAVIENLFAMRKANDLYDQPFDVLLSLTENYGPDFIASLDPAGSYHATVLPWTPSPWGRAPWVKDTEDHTDLEVKIAAMQRFRDAMHQTGLWNKQ